MLHMPPRCGRGGLGLGTIFLMRVQPMRRPPEDNVTMWNGSPDYSMLLPQIILIRIESSECLVEKEMVGEPQNPASGVQHAQTVVASPRCQHAVLYQSL